MTDSAFKARKQRCSMIQTMLSDPTVITASIQKSHGFSEFNCSLFLKTNLRPMMVLKSSVPRAQNTVKPFLSDFGSNYFISNYLTLLSLSFLIYKIGISMAPKSKSSC